MIEAVQVFARDCWRAMGDRDNFLKAHRDAAILLAAILAFCGVAALSQAIS